MRGDTSTPALPTMKCVKYSKQLQIYGRQHTRPGTGPGMVALPSPAPLLLLLPVVLLSRAIASRLPVIQLKCRKILTLQAWSELQMEHVLHSVHFSLSYPVKQARGVSANMHEN